MTKNPTSQSAPKSQTASKPEAAPVVDEKPKNKKKRFLGFIKKNKKDKEPVKEMKPVIEKSEKFDEIPQPVKMRSALQTENQRQYYVVAPHPNPTPPKPLPPAGDSFYDMFLAPSIRRGLENG